MVFAICYLAVLSLKWSYEDTSNSPFFTAMFRILPILLCICIYINSWEKVVSFLKMWITAITIMAILALLTSGIENYGSIGYGGITNQWRNEIGHLSAIAAVIAFILNKMEKKKKYNYIVILLMFFLLFVQDPEVRNGTSIFCSYIWDFRTFFK